MSNLKDALTTAIQGSELQTTVSAQTEPPASPGPTTRGRRTEALHLEENSSGFTVTAVRPGEVQGRLRSTHVLYLDLRRKVRMATGDETWSVRYASQVNDPLLPFLHSSHTKTILFDPMAPFRCPLLAMDESTPVTLILLNSNARYFKSLAELAELKVVI